MLYGTGYAALEAVVAGLAVATLKYISSPKGILFAINSRRTLYVLRINILRSLECLMVLLYLCDSLAIYNFVEKQVCSICDCWIC